MEIKTFVLCLFLAPLLALSGHAQELEIPTGPVILTITGAIDIGNSENVADASTEKTKLAQFDLSMLEKIGMSKVTTETPWTDGMITFEGVLVKDLLALVMAKGKSVRASALDNYSVDIPIEDFQNHNVILATRINGKIMRVRDNGPLWVIYPWTDNSKLKRPHYFARSIWQVHSMTINE